jgi:hypothetical protein
MLDSLKEQEKDTSLYETVCRSLLSEKEFRRVRADLLCILCLCALLLHCLSSQRLCWVQSLLGTIVNNRKSALPSIFH